MNRLRAALAAVALACLMSCGSLASEASRGGSVGPSEPEPGERPEEPGDPPQPPPDDANCDMPAVLAANGCTNQGCHGIQHVAVDLASPGVAARLVGARSATDACRGAILVDPEAPSSSLLLELIDPNRPERCGVPMPFGESGVSPSDVACFEAWVETLVQEGPPPGEVSDFDPVSPETALAKIKTLTVGTAPTGAELEAVRTEGQLGLRRLLGGWMGTPDFGMKLGGFLAVALQQRIKGPIGRQFVTRDIGRLAGNLQESFVQTALDLATRGAPWNQIATTRRWAVTTAVLASLRYTDETFGRRITFGQAPLEASDFEDWRFIELVDARPGESLIDFRDVSALRAVSSRIALRIPRVGFFSTPAFLSNAETNDDNQFRVTTNQTLIVALGQDFSAADTTEPPSLSGLAEEHSAPGTACYGCHRLLDPMRLYFQREYDIQYRRATEPPVDEPAFAFFGQTETGPSMDDFGRALATHPRFPLAWTLKLCQWANGQACDEQDPELQRVVQVFESSGLDLRALVLELLSSPLVTGLEPTTTYAERPFIVSIARQAHLCRLLDARLGTQGLCAQRPVQAVVGLVPDDDFTRGKVEAVQTAVTSAFHFAGTEQLCARISGLVVGGRLDVGLDVGDPDSALISLVERLMGLPAPHLRHGTALAALRTHYESARREVEPLAALRSAFIVACQSPDVMGMGL